MPDTDLIPDLRSKGVKDHTFWKFEGKDHALYLNHCRSLSILISRDQLFHFQWKKHRAFYPLPSQRSKVWGGGRFPVIIETLWSIPPGLFLPRSDRDPTLRKYGPKWQNYCMDKDNFQISSLRHWFFVDLNFFEKPKSKIAYLWLFGGWEWCTGGSGDELWGDICAYIWVRGCTGDWVERCTEGWGEELCGGQLYLYLGA